MKKKLMPILEFDEYKLSIQDEKSNNYNVFKNSEDYKKIGVIHVDFKHAKVFDGEKVTYVTYDINVVSTGGTAIMPLEEFKKVIFKTIF